MNFLEKIFQKVLDYSKELMYNDLVPTTNEEQKFRVNGDRGMKQRKAKNFQKVLDKVSELMYNGVVPTRNKK